MAVVKGVIEPFNPAKIAKRADVNTLSDSNPAMAVVKGVIEPFNPAKISKRADVNTLSDSNPAMAVVKGVIEPFNPAKIAKRADDAEQYTCTESRKCDIGCCGPLYVNHCSGCSFTFTDV